MTSRFVIPLLLLAIGIAGPALAFTETSVSIEPIQPLPGDDFQVIVEGVANTTPVTVADVIRSDQALEIRLQRPSCTSPPCSAQSFRLEIPIDGSTNPFVDRDLVFLQVKGRVGAGANLESLFSAHFAVGEIYSHSMDPEIILNPWTPTDNDRIQLLIPVRTNTCGPSTPALENVERNGSELSVFFRFSPGFGGGFLTETLDPKCTPAIPYLSVSTADLGSLEPGQYVADIYFQSTQDDSLPLRVGIRSFDVTDAPDIVALQGGRFNVELEWLDFDGQSGVGKPVPGPTPDSTLFTFFGRDNWEVLVKVLDGCALNDRFWVFAAAATDVEYTLTVTDTVTGEIRTYTNPLGMASVAINDTDAFDTCPSE